MWLAAGIVSACASKRGGARDIWPAVGLEGGPDLETEAAHDPAHQQGSLHSTGRAPTLSYLYPLPLNPDPRSLGIVPIAVLSVAEPLRAHLSLGPIWPTAHGNGRWSSCGQGSRALLIVTRLLRDGQRLLETWARPLRSIGPELGP